MEVSKMPKYVCDFDTVRTIGKNLAETAGEIKDFLTDYATKITSDTAGWKSDAKTSFEGVNQASKYVNPTGPAPGHLPRAIKEGHQFHGH